MYSIERDHAYQQIEKHVMELKNLNYPVFSIDRDHKFSQIQANIQDLKTLAGKTVYQFTILLKLKKCLLLIIQEVQ